MNRQYIGARYVPKFANPIEWSDGRTFEAMEIVTYLNNSYTSKKPVPSTIGNPASNPEYWVATGNFNAQLEECVEKVDAISVRNFYLSPEEFGAKLDGVTDDTLAVERALAVGCVMLPSNSSIKLNNLSVPDFKTIDFNGSFVYTDSYAIKCIATEEHGYIRNVTIANAHFIVPDVPDSPAHSFGGVYLDGAIKCNIINSEIANAYDGSELAYIRNSFNITLDRIYCGTGNESRTKAYGVSFYCGSPIITGSDNITNCVIKDCLIQNVKYGIYVDSNAGLFDTNKFENTGFTNCEICININGTSSSTRNVTVDGLRAEFSNKGIVNTGYMSIKDVYFTRMTDDAITNSGNMVALGNITGYNPNDYSEVNLFNNSGVINASDTLTMFVNKMVLANTGTFNKPIIKGVTPNDFMTDSYNIVGIATGTSGSAGGEVLLSYPSSYTRDNCFILNVSLYRTNFRWTNIGISADLMTDNIVVKTPTDDSGTFSRAIEVYLMKKSV